MVAIKEQVTRLLRRPAAARHVPPIMIEGETGTGKGLLAQLIHFHGPRRDRPFIDVNCAAIPTTLLEAELFGYERGAFTDARQAKPGLFQLAHGGTIFLDEIGLLPEAVQAKLLKAVEEHSVRRLGATRSEPADALIISATNEDMEGATRDRRFRADLYHRLAVLTLRLPPLRERGADILLLADRQLASICADYDLPAHSFSREARAALEHYRWPGNVRELRNVIERAALLAESPIITAAMLGLPGEATPVAPVVPSAPGPAGEGPIQDALDSLERTLLEQALRETGWNISRAAIRLGISRNTIRYRIEKHGLHPDVSSPERPRRPRPATPARQPAAEEAAPPAILRWESRRVTFLRAVVTPAAGEREAHRVLEVVVDRVRNFGAHIEELSASGLVATFGLEPVEDAPRRAVKAAMAAVKAAERLPGPSPAEGGVRFAIHVAQVLMAKVGGATEIDQAARQHAVSLLDDVLARTGGSAIVVTETAAPLLERRFDLVPMGAPPSRAHGIVGPERTGPGLPASGRLTGFVGRRRELELLVSRFEAAARGRGQFVGITGEAGIGKSRLLLEFRQALAGRAVTCWDGQCRSYGSAIPYQPVLDIVRSSCGIVESDEPEVAGGKVTSTLGALGMEDGESVPCLLHLLEIKEGAAAVAELDPETIKARTLDVLRQLALRAGRQGPLIVLVEDLHWIDQSSEDYLASLVESVSAAAIMVVASYRFGYHPPWSEKSFATQVALPPLAAEESADVLRSVLGAADMPEPVTRQVLAKAEGNPFFIEELARVVLEQRGAVAELAVPDTIEEVLLARIGRLPLSERRVLQAAAVIGTSVRLSLLRVLTKFPDADLRAALRHLRSSEFLVDVSIGADTEYAFTHGLTQQVAYESVPLVQRREDHAAVGFALEREFAGRVHEVVELLAHHFALSEEEGSAVDYALLAAEKAQRRWANAEALAHFDTALGRLATMADTEANRLRRIDAVLKQAEVKFALGRLREHVQALANIQGPIEALGDPRLRATWHYWTGFLGSLTGEALDGAIAHCREAIGIAEAGGFDDVRAFAECCLAHVLLVAGHLQEAMTAGERAFAQFEARGNIWWVCRAVWALSPIANAMGQWARGLDYCSRALEHARAVDDLRLKAAAWLRTGSTHIQRGDPRAGIACCAEALALSPTPFDTAMAHAIRGYGLVKAGDLAAGTAALAQALAWFEQADIHFTGAQTGLWLADAWLRQGNLSRARVVLDEVRARSRELGYRLYEGMALRLAGEAYIDEDPERAGKAIEQACRILEEVGARNELAKTLLVVAELARRRGDPRDARAALDQALAIFRELETLDEPARALAARARLDATPGD